jgi:3-carboxy-cis,cis-muconate cycloisomerase
MKANLDLTGGLIMAEALTMALAPRLGRPEAQRIVKVICDDAIKSGVNLHEVTLKDAQVRAVLSSEEIDHALDPNEYLGSTDAFINRALEAYSEVQSSK